MLRLKEIFSNTSQDKQRLAEENKQLKGLLTQNGVGYPASSVLDDSMSNPSTGYTSSASMSGSYAPASSNASAFTPPPLSATTRGGGISPNSATSPLNQFPQPPSNNRQQPNRNPKFDYEQAGIDFVLAYASPPSLL